MLLDRLVCRCKSQRLQCKLLAEPELTFDKAFKIAKSMEVTEKETKDLQDTPTTAVHLLGKQAPANEKNLRKFPNNPPKQQQKVLECTDVEESTNPLTVDSKRQSATTVKRKDTLPRYATAKPKQYRKPR